MCIRSHVAQRTLTVVAEVAWGFDFDALYEEDKEAPGTYAFEVPGHLDDATAAACALGIFHSTVPIKHLDTIELTVYAEGWMAIEPDYDADWYSLAENCLALWSHHLPEDLLRPREAAGSALASPSAV